MCRRVRWKKARIVGEGGKVQVPAERVHEFRLPPPLQLAELLLKGFVPDLVFLQLRARGRPQAFPAGLQEPPMFLKLGAAGFKQRHILMFWLPAHLLFESLANTSGSHLPREACRPA